MKILLLEFRQVEFFLFHFHHMAPVVTFSKSGRLLFGGYEDFTIRGWDILEDPTSATSCRAHLLGHENRVSSIAINPSGDALLSGSWDTRLRVGLSLFWANPFQIWA